jgi:[NiFe] hydrogenase diaphorase moiety small subunit
VFALSGRGITKHLIVNSESGRLADTDLTLEDKAVSVCPVGVILKKRRGFQIPIGKRKFDQHTASEEAIGQERKTKP